MSDRRYLYRVMKMIAQREQLRKRFSNNLSATNVPAQATNQDKSFYERMETLLNTYYAETDFTVERFVQLSGLGRTVFFAKIKSLTVLEKYCFLTFVYDKLRAEVEIFNRMFPYESFVVTLVLYNTCKSVLLDPFCSKAFLNIVYVVADRTGVCFCTF